MQSSAHPDPLRMTFRLLQPPDAPALRDLRHRAIRECPQYFGTPPEIELARGTAYYRRQILKGRLQGGSVMLGGWAEGSLGAMAGVRRRKLRDGETGLITSMYVAEELRRRGAGEALLRHARIFLETRWGLTRCRMNVEVDNHTALRLYQRAGFRIVRRDENAFRLHGRPYAVYLLESTDPGN